MRFIKQICAAFAAMICLCRLCPITVRAEQAALEPYDILGSIMWDASYEEMTSPELEAGNKKYLEALSKLIVQSDAVCDDGTLRMEADSYIATDDCMFLTWQTTNLTDHMLYVQTSEFDALFNGIEYDLCGGRTWKDYVIRPGETVNSRFTGALLEHVQPGSGEFTLDMRVYEIAEDALPADYFTDSTGLYSGGFYPDETALTSCKSATFTVPMIMGTSDIRSALDDDMPVEKNFDGYALRITKADMSAISFEIEYERIYETEAQARDDSPVGGSYWSYEFNDVSGANWIQSAFGSISDDPVELEDGRWTWQCEYKVYYMYMQPNEIIMHPYYFADGQGIEEKYGTDEDILLLLK